jgi:hypothetical protein
VVMHIKLFKLSALRGVNYFISRSAATFGSDAGYHEMPEAKLGCINVFCGRNGTGKSTILDAVRSLRMPKVLATLRRDVADGHALRAFEITFEDERVVHVEFKSHSREIDVHVLYRKDHRERLLARAFPWITDDGPTKEQQREVRRAIAEIRPMAFHWRGPAQTSVGNRFVAALKLLGSELAGVAHDDGVPSVFQGSVSTIGIEYTADPGVWSTVSIDLLPSGWRAAAGLIAWASRLPKGSIATIEEPETHLHPRLQRRVARELARLTRAHYLQLVVSTHSTVFMNPSSWSEDCKHVEDVHVFQVDGRRFTAVPTPGSDPSRAVAALLDDLGVLASDVMHANSVVWVEGPSDRIYIKYWLRRWSEHRGRATPVENVDYVFCFYGGAVLLHFNAGAMKETDDAIALLKINRNAFVVLDRDNDFEIGKDGEFSRTKDAQLVKYRVVDTLVDQTWVTNGYTIETYLPIAYVDAGYLIEEDGCTKIGKLRTKVELARKYVKETSDSLYQELFRSGLATPCASLEKLHAFITAANSP